MSAAVSTACVMKKSSYGKMLLCYPMSVDPVLFVCGWKFDGPMFGGFSSCVAYFWHILVSHGKSYMLVAGGACEQHVCQQIGSIGKLFV